MQHADHFTRVLNERESFRKDKLLENKHENKSNNIQDSTNSEKISQNSTEVSNDETEVEKDRKTLVEAS